MQDLNPSQPYIPSLLSQQIALHKALAERSQELADMYMSALLVANSDHIPDRFALAAHAIRELIEKLPKYVDVVMKAHKESMGAKITSVESKWHDAVNSSSCYTDGCWQGTVDNPLRRLLNEIDKFFSWKTDHMPKRKDESASLLRKLDSSGKPLPIPLQQKNAEIWEEMRGFFVSTAHHSKLASANEFYEWLGPFERFLLDLLVPRTFADIAEIDAIIQEAEGAEG